MPVVSFLIFNNLFHKEHIENVYIAPLGTNFHFENRYSMFVVRWITIEGEEKSTNIVPYINTRLEYHRRNVMDSGNYTHCFHNSLMFYYEHIARRDSTLIDSYEKIRGILQTFVQNTMSESDQKIACYLNMLSSSNVLDVIENDSTGVGMDFIYIVSKALDIPIFVYLVLDIGSNMSQLMLNSVGFNNNFVITCSDGESLHVSNHEYTNPPMYLLLHAEARHYVLLKEHPL